MRTPDDASTGEDPGALAEGFGSADPDVYGDAADGDEQFGEGSTDSSASAVDALADESASTGVDPLDPSADEADPSLYDVDPGDVATDTDLDLNGDGLVDHADAIEGATALFSFGFEHADDHQAHHDDGGLLDG